LELPLHTVDKDVSAEELSEYTFSTVKTIYLINLDSFTEKQQNILLKFIEEPSDTVFVILTTSAPARVLDTILNRCIRHTFANYTADELTQILNKTVDAQMLNIFKTPGKLKMLTEKSFIDTLAMATTIVVGQRPANYAQFLALITQVNFKDLYDKVDLQLLLDAVEYLAFNDFVQNRSKQSGRILELTTQFRQHAVQSTFIKEMLMVNYLLHVWEISNGTA
jgi:DNA polymerase III gamma/tau subunit